MTLPGDSGESTKLDLRGILTAALSGQPVIPTAQSAEVRRLFEMAPNAIEWCVGDRWCASSDLFEYYRSYQTIRDYFELRCPICNKGSTEDGQPGDCWGKSRMELESEVLLVWNANNLEDTCPKCRTTRSELIEDGLAHGYNQMHLVVGMRAGKSMTAALMGTYFEHVFLCLAHSFDGGMPAYFGITRAEKYEMTFLASNQVQSEDTIWSKYTGFRTNSPWFRHYVPWIKSQERAQPSFGMKKWRYEEAARKIINEHPNVRLVVNSLNSNSSGQAGRTRVHGLLDELSRMKQTDSTQGAEEIYRTLEASLRTVRSRVKSYGGLPWFGSMISVTSPIARDDKAMRLLRKAPDIEDMYARHYPTWEFNPKEPRENFESDYAKDPIGAERDFGANPAGAEYPLIHDEVRWFNLAVDPRRKPQAEFEYYRHVDKTGQEYIACRLRHAERMFDRRMPRYVVFDAGKNFDAFAGACGHGEWVLDDEGNEVLVTVEDWKIRIVPEPGTEAWFESARLIIKAIRKHQYTAFVSFDRWNSVQLIQNIRELGIPAEQQSLNDKDFVDWKVDCFSGRYRALPPAPGELALSEDGGYEHPLRWLVDPPHLSAQGAATYELLGLQCDPDTHKVSNPHKGEERGWNSDDCARTTVHMHKLVQYAGYNKLFDDRTKRGARKKAEYGSARWGQRGMVVNPAAGAGFRNWGRGRGW